MKREILVTDARFPYPVPQKVIDELVKDADGHRPPWDGLADIIDQTRFPFCLRMLATCADKLYRATYTFRYLREGGCVEENEFAHADAICELEETMNQLVNQLCDLIHWSLYAWPYDPLLKEAARGHLRVIQDRLHFNYEAGEHQESAEG